MSAECGVWSVECGVWSDKFEAGLNPTIESSKTLKIQYLTLFRTLNLQATHK